MAAAPFLAHPPSPGVRARFPASLILRPAAPQCNREIPDRIPQHLRDPLITDAGVFPSSVFLVPDFSDAPYLPKTSPSTQTPQRNVP